MSTLYVSDIVTAKKFDTNICDNVKLSHVKVTQVANYRTFDQHGVIIFIVAKSPRKKLQSMFPHFNK